MVLEDFVVRAIIAGLGVAVVGGPLGCFIVWRRMAYFGDTMAHAALLGVALGLLMQVPPSAAIVVVGVALAGLMTLLLRQGRWGSDTLLGIFSHTMLALGLVALSLMETVRVDLMGYLFGDILAVTEANLMWVWGGGILVLSVVALIWRPLLSATVHSDLAAAEGVPVMLMQFALMLLIAVVVAAAMNIVGILLVTSLLVIPAAAARPFVSSPGFMAVLASALGGVAVVGGIMASVQWDTPTGPSIVVMAFGLFLLSLLVGAARRLR
ncbi:MAG: metal ABC transporter permease [Rhodospirillaceae bacterium]